MKLNHLDIPVADPAAVRTFFEDHFGLTCVFARADGLIVLIDELGFALTLSPLPEGEILSYPTGFHVGFNLDDEISVRSQHDRLRHAGVPIVRPLGLLGGAWTFQCHAPGGIVVEIAWRQN
ncbi:MAG: VOC family protein [Rhizobiales bacterium]|nr:VOC family protein [Hyphomicrobiales bacterium]